MSTKITARKAISKKVDYYLVMIACSVACAKKAKRKMYPTHKKLIKWMGVVDHDHQI